MNRIERLVIHHSASARSTTFAAIKHWHTDAPPKGNGWSDIGYNYVILGNGKLRVGRPLPTTGAHAKGKNSTSIGVCVVGNNLKSDQEWRGEMDAFGLIAVARLERGAESPPVQVHP